MQINTDSVAAEWKCENMTPFGCKATDASGTGRKKRYIPGII